MFAFDLFPNERNLADVLDSVKIVRGSRQVQQRAEAYGEAQANDYL